MKSTYALLQGTNVLLINGTSEEVHAFAEKLASCFAGQLNFAMDDLEDLAQWFNAVDQGVFVYNLEADSFKLKVLQPALEKAILTYIQAKVEEEEQNDAA